MAMIPFDDRDGFIWYDGRLLPWRDAKLHVLSHGLHYASCVFEGERVYDGSVFRLDDHNERLLNSAKIMGFEVPAGMDDLTAATRQVITSNNIDDGYVRTNAWLGAEQMGDSAQATKIHLAKAAWGIGRPISRPRRAPKGIRIEMGAVGAPGAAYSTHPGQGVRALHDLHDVEARRRGGPFTADALMLDWRGRLAEDTGANLFSRHQRRIAHAHARIAFLNGLTRQTVIGLAKKRGIKVVVRGFIHVELATADEMFLTGSAAEVTRSARSSASAAIMEFTPDNLPADVGRLRSRRRQKKSSPPLP